MARKVQEILGVVISDKMNKTRIIKVERKETHPLYKKGIILKRKFFVHDEKNETKVGDKVKAVSCRPLSKNKHFRIISKTEEQVVKQ